VPRLKTFHSLFAKAAPASDAGRSERGAGIICSKRKPGKAGYLAKILANGRKRHSTGAQVGERMWHD
jgi:hypothetical protein